MEIRINKFICDSGYCSRREADRLVETRRITINGRVAEMGEKVSPGDTIKVNGNLIENNTQRVYIALNKPKGIVSTTDSREADNITDYVNYPTRIFNIGRLDKDSEGLILLTNDGGIVNKILRASNNHEKEYEVSVDRAITEEFITKMSSGVPILGTTTKRCKVTQESIFKFKIILTQGLNRQIRRMCEYCGYNVVSLKRLRIMNITLGKLPLGQWRELEADEIEQLNRSLAGSDSGEKASKGAGAPKVNKVAKYSKSSPKQSSDSGRSPKQGAKPQSKRGSSYSAKSPSKSGGRAATTRGTSSRGGSSRQTNTTKGGNRKRR